MPRPVLFLDVSRLVRRYEHLGGPTGIDRIELAFARWSERQDAFDARAVTRAGAGLVALRPGALAEVLAALERRWGAGAPPQFGRRGSAARFAAERVAGRARRWRLLAGARPLDADGRANVTLSVGHDGLDEAARWTALPGPFAAVLSDIIPLTHPEYDSPRATELHRARLATLAAHADHVFTITDAAAVVIAAAAPERRFAMSTLHLGPGLAPAPPHPFTRPTFVHLSSIDRRKNLAFLLQLWREMAAKGDCPDLLVIGRRGNDATALQLLDRCEAIRPYVTATGGLGDAEVAARLAGATALLTASFTEGFGLPIVEAHLMGVPAIASDIPPHREIGGASTTYLSPLDGPGWTAAIRAYAAGEAARRRALIAPPPTWDALFARATETLEALAYAARRGSTISPSSSPSQ